MFNFFTEKVQRTLPINSSIVRHYASLLFRHHAQSSNTPAYIHILSDELQLNEFIYKGMVTLNPCLISAVASFQRAITLSLRKYNSCFYIEF